ncbi:MAG: hypothetical protein ACLGH4_00030 [Actinomycetes bacterium]
MRLTTISRGATDRGRSVVGEPPRLVSEIAIIDALTGGGFAPGLHLLAGPPGSGRSSWLSTMARRAVLQGIPVISVCPQGDGADAVDRIHRGISGVADHPPQATDAERRARADAVLSRATIGVLEGPCRGTWELALEIGELAHSRDGPMVLLLDDVERVFGEEMLPAVAEDLAHLCVSRGVVAFVVTASTSVDTWRPEEAVEAWAAFGRWVSSVWSFLPEDDPLHPSGIRDIRLLWARRGYAGLIRLAFLAHLNRFAALATDTSGVPAEAATDEERPEDGPPPPCP